jgi:hypothetical protein
LAGMPYPCETSALFSVVSDYASDLPRRLTLLHNLRHPQVAFENTGVLQSTSLPANAAQHVRNDWLGQAGVVAVKTGWWNRWIGPAEDIMRTTLRRAIEVSLGIGEQPALAPLAVPLPAGKAWFEDGDVLTGGPSGPFTRSWPIELLWTCGPPTFQGYVSWKRHGTGPSDGQVTVNFVTPEAGYTPAAGRPMMYDGVVPHLTETLGKALVQGTVYPSTKQETLLERGHWVVGAVSSKINLHLASRDVNADGAILGIELGNPPSFVPLIPLFAPLAIRLPDATNESRGPDAVVRTVRISVADGGANNPPVTYTP